MGHSFGEADLQVVGDMLAVVLKGFQLYAEVFQRDGDREVGIDVIIIQSDVDSQRQRRKFGILGVEHFERSASRPSVVEEVCVTGGETEVLGRKTADDIAVGVGLVHRAIAQVLRGDGSRVPFAEGFDKRGAYGFASCGIGHEVESQRAVAYGRKERRIVHRRRRVVVDCRNVRPTQCGGVRRLRELQKVVGRRTLLSLERRTGGEQQPDEVPCFFHPVIKNCGQSYINLDYLPYFCRANRQNFHDACGAYRGLPS